ncbi:MAG: PQQ-binding-like beta-propeller repeat protein [Burkholderiales bacterium]
MKTLWSHQVSALVAKLIPCLLLILGACSSPGKPTPKPLEPIPSPITGRVIWKQNLGSMAFPLSVAVQGRDTLALADGDGLIRVLKAESGQLVWQLPLGEQLQAGVGFDGRVAAVVTRQGEVVAAQSSGVLWRQALPVPVVTAPLVAGERVFVLASDRSVHAFDALDGRRLWVFRRPSDSLTLLQPGVLRASGRTLVVGQGPRMMGLDPLNGAILWDVALSFPRGINELERLADLIGPSARVGDLICARAFQSAIGCINTQQNTLVWNKNLGGTMGVAADNDLLYVADASDRISAWRTHSGALAWARDALLHHGLTAPALVGSSLVFGDQAGRVHFLSRHNGKDQLRIETDGSAIVATPVVVGTTVVVVTRQGGVFCIRPVFSEN